MRILVTGSTGHLGEALVRTLAASGHDVVGLDRLPSPHTNVVGSIVDRDVVAQAMRGVQAVLHAATLHKPHVATHARQDFIDANVSGTLNLLEEAVVAGVSSFVFTSTTSAFGAALSPPPGAPAAWITEDVVPVPKNIYGATKTAAEDLCQVFHRRHRLPCVVLRTSRFFPEADDNAERRDAYADANLKLNEFLYRRVELEDVVDAHACALQRAPAIGFDRIIVSATTPFAPTDLEDLAREPHVALARAVPEAAAAYADLGWKPPARIDRVYVNARAREVLGWRPRHDFRSVLERMRAGGDWRSPLARLVGAKGYHAERFAHGPYPVESSPAP